MTEFRFAPFKLPEPAEVEARPAGAREEVGIEFRFAPVEFAEPTQREARPLDTWEPASAEFRFPPVRLPEPAGNRTLAPASTGSSCCANCEQGLPCASKTSGCTAAHAPHHSRCHVAPNPGIAQSSPRPTTSPAPETQFRGEAKQPLWEPLDIEAKLKPMLLCCPKSDPNQVGCDQGVPSCEEDPEPRPPRPSRPPNSHCAPIPIDTDDYESDHLRCSLTPCIDQAERCLPIAAGIYSAKSRAQPVFSYSKWKDGKLVDGGADCSIIRAIAYHIDMSQAGDEVLIAIAAWWTDGWTILKAVQDASARGVTVRVITGGGKQSDWFHTSTWIKKPLEDSVGTENVKYWAGTHNPFGGQISHNKFVLIQRKSSNQHLLLLTGANWARFDVARHCDLLTLDSFNIWNAFRQYWLQLWSSSPTVSAIYPSNATDPVTGVTAQFWPLVDAKGNIPVGGETPKQNPFYQIINKYKEDKLTKIRIIASNWTGGLQGKDIFTLLQSYRKGGADVRVVGNHHLDTGCHMAKTGGCQFQPGQGAKVGSCETTDTVWGLLEDGNIPWAKCAPHAKVILISGFLKSNGKWNQAVYTGSMNISYELSMPDSFVGVHDDPVIFSQYEKWWNWLCSSTAMNRGGTSGPKDHPCGDILALF